MADSLTQLLKNKFVPCTGKILRAAMHIQFASIAMFPEVDTVQSCPFEENAMRFEPFPPATHTEPFQAMELQVVNKPKSFVGNQDVPLNEYSISPADWAVSVASLLPPISHVRPFQKMELHTDSGAVCAIVADQSTPLEEDAS